MNFSKSGNFIFPSKDEYKSQLLSRNSTRTLATSIQNEYNTQKEYSSNYNIYESIEKSPLRPRTSIEHFDDSSDQVSRLKLMTESLKQQLNSKAREASELMAERDALREVNEHRNHTISLLRNELQSALDDNRLLTEENESLKKRNTDMSKTNKELLDKLISIEESHEKHTEDLIHKSDRIDDLERVRDRLISQDKYLQIELDRAKEQLKMSDEKLRYSQQKLFEESEKVQQQEAQIKKLNISIEKMKSEHEYYKNLLDEERSTNKTLELKNMESEKLIETKNSEIKRIKDELDSIEKKKSEIMRNTLLLQEKLDETTKENKVLNTYSSESLGFIKTIIKEDINVKHAGQKLELERKSQDIVHREIREAMTNLESYFKYENPRIL